MLLYVHRDHENYKGREKNSLDEVGDYNRGFSLRLAKTELIPTSGHFSDWLLEYNTGIPSGVATAQSSSSTGRGKIHPTESTMVACSTSGRGRFRDF